MCLTRRTKRQRSWRPSSMKRAVFAILVSALLYSNVESSTSSSSSELKVNLEGGGCFLTIKPTESADDCFVDEDDQEDEESITFEPPTAAPTTDSPTDPPLTDNPNTTEKDTATEPGEDVKVTTEPGDLSTSDESVSTPSATVEPMLTGEPDTGTTQQPREQTNSVEFGSTTVSNGETTDRSHLPTTLRPPETEEPSRLSTRWPREETTSADVEATGSTVEGNTEPGDFTTSQDFSTSYETESEQPNGETTVRPQQQTSSSELESKSAEEPEETTHMPREATPSVEATTDDVSETGVTTIETTTRSSTGSYHYSVYVYLSHDRRRRPLQGKLVAKFFPLVGFKEVTLSQRSEAMRAGSVLHHSVDLPFKVEDIKLLELIYVSDKSMSGRSVRVDQVTLLPAYEERLTDRQSGLRCVLFNRRSIDSYPYRPLQVISGNKCRPLRNVVTLTTTAKPATSTSGVPDHDDHYDSSSEESTGDSREDPSSGLFYYIVTLRISSNFEDSIKGKLSAKFSSESQKYSVYLSSKNEKFRPGSVYKYIVKLPFEVRRYTTSMSVAFKAESESKWPFGVDYVTVNPADEEYHGSRHQHYLRDRDTLCASFRSDRRDWYRRDRRDVELELSGKEEEHGHRDRFDIIRVSKWESWTSSTQRLSAGNRC